MKLGPWITVWLQITKNNQDFFADLPGMEGMRMVTDPKRLVIDLVRTKLSQNSGAD